MPNPSSHPGRSAGDGCAKASTLIRGVHSILYVEDQERSAAFYSAVLRQSPDLHVEGMTEFRLNGGAVLGLMPVVAIRKLLGDRLPDPESAMGVPRAEIYLYVDHPESYHQRALDHGGRELSPPERRSWGDVASYVLDPDGHVLAFASRKRPPDSMARVEGFSS